MKRILILALVLFFMGQAQSSSAFSIGGSVGGGGFGVGVSSDGSARVSGGRGPVSGSVHMDSNSGASQNSGSGSDSGGAGTGTPHHVYGKPIFEIAPADFPKYKGKTPKVYARLNGALIYSDVIYLYYNKVDKQIEVKTLEPDGSVRHSAMLDKDVVVRMPKGPCKLQNNDFICPK